MTKNIRDLALNGEGDEKKKETNYLGFRDEFSYLDDMKESRFHQELHEKDNFGFEDFSTKRGTSYDEDGLPELEPGQIRIKIAVPIEKCGSFCEEGEYQMLTNGEDEAAKIIEELIPDVVKNFEWHSSSIESVDTVDVTVTLSPQKSIKNQS